MLILVLLAAVAGSALFAGLETGVVSLNRVRLRFRARRGDSTAAALLKLLQRPERTLSTFLVGNTLCNVGGGAVASYWAIEALRDETAGSLTATVVMSATFLIFSEMGPKAYFRVRAEESVPRLLWFIKAAQWVFAPVVWLASGMFRLIIGGSGRAPFVTREELRQMVRAARGRLGDREQRMLQSVFDFSQTVVREVMIPLPDVVSLPESARTDDLLQVVRQRRFTRIPIYRNRVDTIIGLVNVFDVLYDPDRSGDIARYLRPIQVVPETSRINRVLMDLQRRRETMALVVNEFGSCIGIVTLEDFVEEIMGEMVDEEQEPQVRLQRVGDGFVVDAGFDIDDLNQELGLSLHKDRYDTVGGLILGRLGRIPEVGERVQSQNVVFEVLAVHEYGINKVKIRVSRGGKTQS